MAARSGATTGSRCVRNPGGFRDQPKHDPAFSLFTVASVLVEALAPGVMQPPPVVLGGAGSHPRLVVVEPDVLERVMQLVPFDLVRDQRRHQVVDVRSRGDQHRQRGPVLVPAAPPRRGFHSLPRQDFGARTARNPGGL